jgi:CRISPR-associated protein Cas1
VGQPSNFLHILIRKVRPGDPENIEAQAARRYWATLFGDEFRRDRGALGVNSMLNYGYMVLRSAVARAIIAAGLHPTLGLHHSNEGNAMRLVDDLMEPFRPLLDLKVWRLLNEGEKEVTPETKRQLVRVLFADMNTEIGLTPLSVCAQRLATSLALLYLGERKKLELPRAGLPIDLSLSGSSS